MEIRLEGVSFTYPSGAQALADIDLTFGAGAAVGIIGANGSGKTTLARHLDGLLRPASGRVLLDRVDAATRSTAQLAAQVGLAFQDPDRQIFERTVRAEVSFGPRQRAWSDEQRRHAVDAALEATGLADAADLHPGELGAGRRKLLTMASVLAMQTPVVVLDEPTIGLDRRGIDRIAGLIEQLRSAGRTVVGISHDLRFVAESFERIVVLEAGRLVSEGTPAEVFDEGAWPMLERSGLAPPRAARLGAALGLGSTPTEGALVAAARRRAGEA